jgi:hypothetical protein
MMNPNSESTTPKYIRREKQKKKKKKKNTYNQLLDSGMLGAAGLLISSVMGGGKQR